MKTHKITEREEISSVQVRNVDSARGMSLAELFWSPIYYHTSKQELEGKFIHSKEKLLLCLMFQMSKVK